jgi:hypothetical protein
MAERVSDDKNTEHILSNAIPTENILDIVLITTIHAENVKILMGDPALMPYHSFLLHLHEDMIRIMGFLQIAFDVDVREAVDHAEQRAENFHKVDLGKSIEEHYEGGLRGR